MHVSKIILLTIALLSFGAHSQVSDGDGPGNNLMFCSEQLGGGSTSHVNVRKICLNSHQLILSYKDTSRCRGFYNGNDSCVENLGEEFDEIFNIESVDVIKFDSSTKETLSKINLLSLKTGERSFVHAQSTKMKDCIASGISGSILDDLMAYYVCK